MSTTITASMVKTLRERTGAGMMECKKALVEAGGDSDAAAEALRTSGQAKADKKAGRVAADGRVVIAAAGGKAVIAEVNSETDFAAKEDNFIAFAEAVAAAVLESGTTDVAALADVQISDGRTVETARTDLITKVGEKYFRTTGNHRRKCRSGRPLHTRCPYWRGGSTGRW